MNVRNTQLPIYAFLGLYVDPTISDKKANQYITIVILSELLCLRVLSTLISRWMQCKPILPIAIQSDYNH